MSKAQPSKSKRIQDFIRLNPATRNRDVVEALAEFGVTTADVSNAKAQLKKKLGNRRSRTVVPADDTLLVTGEQPLTLDSGNSITLVELEAAVEYIQTVGGIQRAQQLLSLVRHIQAL